MSNLDINDIERVAGLANLRLIPKEKKSYLKDLTAVFDYINILNEVNTEDVPETAQVTGLEDVVREDKISSCSKDTVDSIKNQFPESDNNLLKVKTVFKE
ncbi:MAG: Asp-tRNA(Asn)/Glu-tRNA(Gln) amidotransferase subunit GatC [Candidatus Magasanikbacteria bacterium]|nr:Asp-tRNA(Asn)/Glu-tRNA(Gln) amidotransferase subunit GatC [Candidatus Magasanikbacteria bacterium]